MLWGGWNEDINATPNGNTKRITATSLRKHFQGDEKKKTEVEKNNSMLFNQFFPKRAIKCFRSILSSL